MSDDDVSRTEHRQVLSSLRDRMVTIERTITRLLAGVAEQADTPSNTMAHPSAVLAPSRVGIHHRRWM